MNRLLMIASVTFMTAGLTGCLHRHTRGGCSSGTCSTGACASGSCASGTCASGTCSSCGKAHGAGGLLGKLHGGGLCSHCAGGRTGCVAGPLGWQQGGLNYSSHLGPPHGIGQGAIAQHIAPGHYAAQQLQSQPFNPGPPSGTVAYPYYTHRGPRDFLLDNPPSIGR